MKKDVKVMKIAYFLDVPKGLGGAGNLLLQRAYLMSECNDVVVVLPSDQDGCSSEEYAVRCTKYNMRYICIEYSTAYSFTILDFMGAMESAAAIEKFAMEEKIDLFHSVQLNIAVEYVSRKLKIPHLMDIYSIHEGEFKICKDNIYPKYHLCDSLIYSNMWREHLGVESRCIRPMAPIDSIRKKEKKNHRPIRILMLGIIWPYKNQLVAIKAVERCIKYYSNLELHILGLKGSSYSKMCEEYVKEKQLVNIVFFEGFISNIVPYLESSDCLLCTSTRESFPLSIVEAITYDLTIISTPVAGIPEVFVDKENAFIAKDFSEDSVVESILNYIEYCQNGKIDYIHRNAEQAWLKNFDRKLVIEQTESYYKAIVENKNFESIEPFYTLKEKMKDMEAILTSIDSLGEDFIYNRVIYYSVVQKKLKKGKIYIWGAGKWGMVTLNILRTLCPNLEIIAFIDNDRKGCIHNIPIKRPEDITCDRQYYYSVSFNVGRDEAIQYLENKGLKLFDNIWTLP